MIELEVFGAAIASGAEESTLRSAAARVPSLLDMRRLCTWAAAAAGVHDGHVAIEFVDAERITALNAEYRDEPAPTDVLSFPVDGAGSSGSLQSTGALDPGSGEEAAGAPKAVVGGPADSARELGDVVICLEHTIDVREAVVHGVLHLLGMDHETDNGEMLTLQRELLARESH